MKAPILFISLFLLASCQSRTKLNEDGTITVHGHYTPPVDHVLHAGDVWQDKRGVASDSVKLWYAAYACDCPSWVAADVAKLENDNSKNYYRRLSENSFYVEPRSAEDPLYSCNNIGMTLVFYGRLDTVKRYPKNAHFVDPDPQMGKVFVYSGYRVVDAGSLAGGDTAYDYEYDSIVR